MSLVEIRAVSKSFGRGKGPVVRAVRDVTLNVEAGEVVALIGESGSGKSTVARLALGLLFPDTGSVAFDGRDLATLPSAERRRLRRRFQAVFQEPYESLSPRLTVGDNIREPIAIHERGLSSLEQRRLVVEALDHVGLDHAYADRYPAELSGGEQQRVGVARAIVTRPEMIVLDEPTSSLDLSIRAAVLMLLSRLQKELNLAYLFISHDISTVEFISTRTLVMYRGQIVESGSTSEVTERPQHPYTKALLRSRLSPDPRVRPAALPLVQRATADDREEVGCSFYARCPIATTECAAAPIPLFALQDERWARCIKVEAITAGALERTR